MRDMKTSTFLILAVLLTVAVLVFKQVNQNVSPSPVRTPQISSPQVSSSPGQVLGQQTKTTGCTASDGLPDRACTPGAVIEGVTKDQVCTHGYSRSVRNVPTRVKDEVYREYGIVSHEPGQYEVDHLVSLELGGSNDIANLWPETADPRPGFHEKDQVENYLHDQVCSGNLSLQEAQQEIASNWQAVYQNTSQP